MNLPQLVACGGSGLMGAFLSFKESIVFDSLILRSARARVASATRYGKR